MKNGKKPERETTAKHPGKESTNAKFRRQKRTSNFRKTESRLVWLNLSEREDIESTGSR